MSNDRGGSAWGKACGLGCGGCGLVLLIFGAITAAFAPNAVDRIKGVIDREAMMENWQGPPEGTSIEALLPSEVDGLTRGPVEMGPGPEVLALDDEEWSHATYSNDERTIEVWANRADETEREELFSWSKTAIQDLDEGLTSTTTIGTVQSFRFGRPAKSVSLWWADDWIFLFYAEQAGNMGSFGSELFRSTDRGSAVD